MSELKRSELNSNGDLLLAPEPHCSSLSVIHPVKSLSTYFEQGTVLSNIEHEEVVKIQCWPSDIHAHVYKCI